MIYAPEILLIKISKICQAPTESNLTNCRVQFLILCLTILLQSATFTKSCKPPAGTGDPQCSKHWHLSVKNSSSKTQNQKLYYIYFECMSLTKMHLFIECVVMDATSLANRAFGIHSDWFHGISVLASWYLHLPPIQCILGKSRTFIYQMLKTQCIHTLWNE